MCELFAMSAQLPTNVRVSLDELARHGGGTGPHGDGWGVAFLQQGDVQLVREPEAAHASACLAFLKGQELTSQTVLAHIRKATQGARLLRNTQPFVRELGGVSHVFAHNGDLPGIEVDRRFPTARFRRVGDTDSEHAFCALLDRLTPLWEHGLPPLEARLEAVAAFAAELRTRGAANFLYADGDAVFAHGHRRRNAAGVVAPPGLHVLCRTCHPGAAGEPIEGLRLEHGHAQHVALVASVPLSAEGWEPLGEGEVAVLRQGRVAARHLP